MQLMVMGMHRSGTSVLARLLNLMGAYFGAEGTSTGANQENPKGFWERRDVRVLNDSVLFSAGCDWNRVSKFNVDALPQAVVDDFRKRAFPIVLDMDAHRPWLLKEPRLCLLLPLWRSMLEAPVCIHILRHPVEVAASLQTRNGIPIPAGLALWERYNRDALRGMQGLPTVVVAHRELMLDPARVAQSLHDQLTEIGVGGLRMPNTGEVQAFVRGDLYREHDDREDLKRYARASQVLLFKRWSQGRITPKDLAAEVPATGRKALLAYEQGLPPFQPKPPPLSGEAQQRALLSAKEKELKIETEKKALLESEAEQNRRDRAAMESEIKVLKEWVSTSTGEYAQRLAETDAGRTAAVERLAKIEAERAAIEVDLRRLAEADAGKAAAMEQVKRELKAAEARCAGLAERLASQEGLVREREARLSGLQQVLEASRQYAEKEAAALTEKSRALQDQLERLQEQSGKEQASLRGHAKVLESELVQARAGADAERSLLTDRSEALQLQLEQLRAASEQESAVAEARCEAMQREMEMARQQAEAELLKLGNEAGAVQAGLRQELAASQHQHARELDAAKEQSREIGRNLKARFGEIATLTKLLSEQEAARSGAEATIKGLRGSLEQANARHRASEDALSSEQEAGASRAASLERRAVQARQMYSRSEAEAVALRGELRKQEAALASQVLEIEARDRLLQERARRLDEVSARLDRLMASTSWRLMGPFRRMRTWFSGGGDGVESSRVGDAALVRESKWFDADWYVRQYPDIAVSGTDPALHYVEHGASEGRDPGPGFSSLRYLQENADVAAAGLNPLVHFLRHGGSEGRKALASNKDGQV